MSLGDVDEVLPVGGEVDVVVVCGIGQAMISHGR